VRCAPPAEDGLAQQERIALEEKAIALILGHEPDLQRTPANGPGFDLVALNQTGTPLTWIETFN